MLGPLRFRPLVSSFPSFPLLFRSTQFINRHSPQTRFSLFPSHAPMVSLSSDHNGPRPLSLPPSSPGPKHVTLSSQPHSQRDPVAPLDTLSAMMAIISRPRHSRQMSIQPATHAIPLARGSTSCTRSIRLIFANRALRAVLEPQGFGTSLRATHAGFPFSVFPKADRKALVPR